MASAHAHLDITPEEFEAIAPHLDRTLAEFEVAQDDREAVVEAVYGYEEAIVTRATAPPRTIYIALVTAPDRHVTLLETRLRPGVDR